MTEANPNDTIAANLLPHDIEIFNARYANIPNNTK